MMTCQRITAMREARRRNQTGGWTLAAAQCARQCCRNSATESPFGVAKAELPFSGGTVAAATQPHLLAPAMSPRGGWALLAAACACSLTLAAEVATQGLGDRARQQAMSPTSDAAAWGPSFRSTLGAQAEMTVVQQQQQHQLFSRASAGEEQRMYHMGFLDDYRCTGRIYDEPRRWRMKCAHNPRRLMPCRCKSQSASSPLVTCDCGEPISSMAGTATPLQAIADPATINAASLPEPRLVA